MFQMLIFVQVRKKLWSICGRFQIGCLYFDDFLLNNVSCWIDQLKSITGTRKIAGFRLSTECLKLNEIVRLWD